MNPKDLWEALPIDLLYRIPMRLRDLLRLQIVQRFGLVDAWFQIGQLRDFKIESLIQNQWPNSE